MRENDNLLYTLSICLYLKRWYKFFYNLSMIKMPKNKLFTKSLLLKLSIVVVMLAVAFIFYDQLPTLIPTHWNVYGQADAYWPKNISLFTIPGLVLLLILWFNFIPKFDPRKEKYEQFQKSWDMLQFIIISFFAYVYFVSIYVAMHPAQSMNFFMMFWVGLFFVLLGNYLWKIRSNYFVGIKTPWTLENEEVWNKTHRLGWYMFVISWLIFMINSFLNFQVWLVFIIVMLLAVFVPIIYSYVIYKKLKINN